MRITITIEDNDNQCSSHYSVETNDDTWTSLIDPFITALNGHGFRVDEDKLAKVLTEGVWGAGQTGDSCPDLTRWATSYFKEKPVAKHDPYPLCTKYKCPLVDDRLRDCDYANWIVSLDDYWWVKFPKVMGPVTRDDKGIYACDVEDTLYALENGLPHRRSNG